MGSSQKMEIPHQVTHFIENYHSKSLGGTNIWQSILNNVAQRDDMRESNLIVLGDKGAGKRSLIQSINMHCVKANNKFIEVEKMGS